jgi:hypothetical protein
MLRPELERGYASVQLEQQLAEKDDPRECSFSTTELRVA